MSTSLPEITVTEVQKTWDALTALVEGFIEAWESGVEPRLGDVVPAAPVSYRRLALVELIKVDLDYRWKRGKPTKVENYLRDFPELHDGGIPCDLLYEEYHIRKQAGDQVEAHEYLARFPSRADELKRLLGVQSRSTSVLAKARFEDLKPGERLDDFDLLKLLGQGAFAKVFLAWQGSMQRQVAVKISADQGSEPQGP